MNDRATQIIEIDLKDLLCLILKRIVGLVVVAAMFGCLGAGYAIHKSSKTSSVAVTNVLDADTRLPSESDEAYENRVDSVNRITVCMDNIEMMTERSEIQTTYLNDSLLMNIDPLNTACTQAQVVISCNDEANGAVDALYSAYLFDLTNGNYLSPIAEELDCKVGAIQELIQINDGDQNSDYSVTVGDSLERFKVINVQVVGYTEDITNSIMDCIVSEITSLSNELDGAIAAHDIDIINRQSYVSYNRYVQEKQYSALNSLNSIQSQLNSYNTYLDNIAKGMGLKDRTAFYSSSATTVSSGISIKSVVKFGLIGFLLGFVLFVGCVFLDYVFGKRIISKTQFLGLFNSVPLIGVCKPSTKNTGYYYLLNKLSGDDDGLTQENSLGLISNNYYNLTRDYEKILITGTADKEIVDSVIKELSVRGDIKLNIFDNPSILKQIREYDCVVIVEQRGYSKKKTISEEIELIRNSGVPILGAIIT